jgi:transcriptional regulator with XRE-family HTH domain
VLGDIVSADGLSQADVAVFSGLSPSAISRL